MEEGGEDNIGFDDDYYDDDNDEDTPLLNSTQRQEKAQRDSERKFRDIGERVRKKANEKRIAELRSKEHNNSGGENVPMNRLSEEEANEWIKRELDELYPQFSSKESPRVGFRSATTKDGVEIVEAKLWGEDKWVGIQDIDNIPPRMKEYLGPTREEVSEWRRISDRMRNEFPRNSIPEEPQSGWGLKESGKDENGNPIVMIKVPGDDKYKKIHTKKGKVSEKLSSKVMDVLGKESIIILEENDKKVEETNEKKEELPTQKEANTSVINDEEASTSAKAEARAKNTQIDKLNAKLDEILDKVGKETDDIKDNMTIRERVKEIFKKYGFTATAIVASIGVIIGVIVSNLKSGLGKVAKGMGNGLKTIGKKLGQILPGIAGAIASFIFKTAGEVVGFLGKHAWLLIVAVVLYAIEKIKKKK